MKSTFGDLAGDSEPFELQFSDRSLDLEVVFQLHLDVPEVGVDVRLKVLLVLFICLSGFYRDLVGVLVEGVKAAEKGVGFDARD